MLHGFRLGPPAAVPSRPAHRAAPSGLALIVRQTVSPTTGQHRQPSTRSPLRVLQTSGCALREPQRAMQRLTSGLGALIVVNICGLIAFFIVADERRGHAQPTAAPEPPSREIASRDVDPRPLTLSEVFPDKEIRVVDGGEPYVRTMIHIDSDCERAVTGALGEVLAAADCTQVVRAALTAPYGDYRVTAGLFNLADDSGARRASHAVRELVETGGGSFAVLAPDAALGSAPQAATEAQIGWQEHGHYLVYCVITRPDNSPLAAADPYARQITADLVETHLTDVLAARTS
jgi:hypothetical protein